MRHLEHTINKIILAPDSFKGTLGATEICGIEASAIGRLLPDAEIVSIPMADGGEGMTESYLSILGGEPFHPVNRKGALELARIFKERFPDKDIWSWTGYTFERLGPDYSGFENFDVIVDGQFQEELKNPMLHWRGSANQRVIDIPRTMREGHIVTLYEGDEGLKLVNKTE